MSVKHIPVITYFNCNEPSFHHQPLLKSMRKKMHLVSHVPLLPKYFLKVTTLTLTVTNYWHWRHLPKIYSKYNVSSQKATTSIRMTTIQCRVRNYNILKQIHYCESCSCPSRTVIENESTSSDQSESRPNMSVLFLAICYYIIVFCPTLTLDLINIWVSFVSFFCQYRETCWHFSLR